MPCELVADCGSKCSCGRHEVLAVRLCEVDFNAPHLENARLGRRGGRSPVMGQRRL